MSGLIQNLLSGAVPQQDRSTFNLDVSTPFQENLGGIEDVLAQRGLEADEQKNPLRFKTETNKDGKLETTVTAPHEEIVKIQEKMKLLDQILGSFHDRSQYLQAQEQAGRQRSPILQALSSVAGHLATGDKRLPPIVAALGKANLEMNPSQQELGQRAQQASMAEAAVAKEQAGLAQASLGLQIEEERVKEQTKEKQERITQAQEKIQQAKIESVGKEARLHAKGGVPMTFEAFRALAQSRGVKDPELIHEGYIAHQNEAMNAKTALEEKQKDRKALQDAAVAGRIQEHRVLEDQRQGNRIALERDKFANSISPSALEAKKSLIDYGAKVHEAVAQDKELSLIGGPDMKKLEGAAQTDAYLNKVTGGLSRPELRNVVGPLFSAYKDKKTGEWVVNVNIEKIKPAFAQSADRQEMVALFSHEMPRIMSTVLNLQGGASILRSEAGREMVAKLGAAIGQRPDQILQILETVRDTNNDVRSTVMKAHPKVDWKSRGDLMGFDDQKNDRYWKEGKDSMGGKVHLPSSLKGSPQPPPAEILKGLKPGKAIKDKDGNLWDSNGALVGHA